MAAAPDYQDRIHHFRQTREISNCGTVSAQAPNRAAAGQTAALTVYMAIERQGATVLRAW